MGQTVISTIHQPSSEIFRLFDRLMILADGKTVYFGDREGATLYFSKLGDICNVTTLGSRRLGYECPKFINPADYLMKVVQVNPMAIEGGEDMPDKEDDAFIQSRRIRYISHHLVASPSDNVGLRNATREQVDKLKEAFLKSKLFKDATNPPTPQNTHVESGRSSYVARYPKPVILQTLQLLDPIYLVITQKLVEYDPRTCLI